MADQNLNSSDKKPIKKLSDLPEKQAIITMMQNEGYSKDEIMSVGKELNLKENTINDYRYRYRKYFIKENPQLLKSASNTLKKIIKGKTFGEIKEIKDSTALQAAKMVYDREEPVIQHVKTQNESLVAVVDLDKYRNRSGDKPSETPKNTPQSGEDSAE